MAKLIRRPRIIGAPIERKTPQAPIANKAVNTPDKTSEAPKTAVPQKISEVETPTPKKRRTIMSANTEVNSPVSVVQKKPRKVIGEIPEEKSIQDQSQEDINVPFRANSSWPPLQWQDIGFTPSTNYKSSPEHVIDEPVKPTHQKESSPPVRKAKIIELRTEDRNISTTYQKPVESKHKLSKTYNDILLPDSIPPRDYDGILNWLSSAYGDDNDFSYIQQDSVIDLAISMWLGQLNDEIYKPREEMVRKKEELKIY